MNINGEEEHRRAVRVHVAQEPTVIHVAHDVFDAVERAIARRNVVHREHDAGDDLDAQHDGEDRAERVPEIQVPGRRKGEHRIVREPHERQALIEPAAEGSLWDVSGLSGHLSLLNRSSGVWA